MIELWAAFLLGLAGSLHCAGMCGPIALAIPVQDRGRFFLARLAYNGGRILSYAILGGIFGLLGASLTIAGLQRSLSLGAGIALIVMLILSRRTSVLFAPAIASLKSLFAKCLKHQSLSAVTALGMLNGFLPCGLSYAAATGAVATGSWLRAVEFMTVFGLGTVPMMVAIGLVGQRVQWKLRFKFAGWVPVALVLLALLLVLRGLPLDIPGLSPDRAGQCQHCR